MKKLLFTAILGLLAFSFTSCKKDNSLVAAITFNSNLEWFKEGIMGMQDMAEKKHIKFKNYDSYYDTEVEFEIARSLTKSNIKAVIISPIDYTKSKKAVGYLKNHGIKVISWNTFVNFPVDSEIIVNSNELGAKTGRYLNEYFEENNLSGIKAALITNESYTVARERYDGFKNAIEPLIESEKIEIVSEFESELKEETKLYLRTLIHKNPDVKLIWCWNQTTLENCMYALQDFNRTDILLCGTDLSVDTANQMLKENTNLIAVTSQDPYTMGSLALENAFNAIKGKTIDRVVEVPVTLYTYEDKAELKKYIKEKERLQKRIKEFEKSTL